MQCEINHFLGDGRFYVCWPQNCIFVLHRYHARCRRGYSTTSQRTKTTKIRWEKVDICVTIEKHGRTMENLRVCWFQADKKNVKNASSQHIGCADAYMIYLSTKYSVIKTRANTFLILMFTFTIVEAKISLLTCVHVCACVCVCVCVCKWVHVCACASVCRCVWERESMYACMCVVQVWYIYMYVCV
jgi:hypothetical protein